MGITILPARLRKFEIPGRVTFANGSGGLPKINITTGRSTAGIYLHGAHIAGFQKNGEPPLLFMSRLSHFAAGKAICGGVPVCFPWFGRREGDVIHGFARNTEWDLIETAAPARRRCNDPLPAAVNDRQCRPAGVSRGICCRRHRPTGDGTDCHQ